MLARLASGLPLDGELARATPALRPLIDRLAATPLDRRTDILDGFSSSLTDPAAFARSIADIDPTGPAPPIEATASAEAPSVKMTCAADITPRAVDWLWPGRVPLGMLTLFAGDPKLGKSYVALATAASVSCGTALPGGDVPERPGSIIIMSAEDDPARTIVPRLVAAGANRSKIHILESVILANGLEALPSLSVDLDRIEAAAASIGDCKLIIIDPVPAYLGGIDDHRNAELRGVLSPLKAMAERLNVAIVLISHLSKSGGTNGKHRVIGSIAYVGACRANFLFVRDRTDPTGRRILMCDNGGNLGPTAPTLAYVIEDRDGGPRVEWLDKPVAITAEQALASETEAAIDPELAAENRACDRWLREMLAAGRQLAVDVWRAGQDAGFSRDALKRAKLRIGAETEREGFGPGSKCYWRLGDASTNEVGGAIERTLGA
jgi:hypothetical protein